VKQKSETDSLRPLLLRDVSSGPCVDRLMALEKNVE